MLTIVKLRKLPLHTSNSTGYIAIKYHLVVLLHILPLTENRDISINTKETAKNAMTMI